MTVGMANVTVPELQDWIRNMKADIENIPGCGNIFSGRHKVKILIIQVGLLGL